MKKGNQCYLEVQIFDKNGSELKISDVSKVQFNIGSLTKTYDEDEEVTYDTTNKCFKIWLLEEETFEFDDKTKMDARILFNNDTIMGTYIEQNFIYDSLKQVPLIEEEEDV